MDINHILWCTVQFLGPALVEASYLPQLVRLHRLKHAEEFSLWWPVLNLSGRAMEIVIAWYAQMPFFSLAVIIGFAIRTTFFGQVIYYRWKVRQLAQLRSEEIAI